jgi:hypothetical protein
LGLALLLLLVMLALPLSLLLQALRRCAALQPPDLQQ